MRKVAMALAIGVATFGLAAPAMSAPVEVTRFHLGVPVDPGTVSVERTGGGGTPSTEIAAYLAAVKDELGRTGFAAGTDPAQPSQYVATVDVLRGPRDLFEQRPAGTMPSRTVRGGRRGGIISELSVQLKRRADGSLVWEGRAQTAGATAPGKGAALAPRLAHALFGGFPGKSGVTISVP